MLLPNLCTSVQSVGVFVGGYGIPAIPTPPSDIPPTEFTEFTEASGVGYSPTDFTDAHRFLGCVLPPNLFTSVQSVGVFVGGYGILPYPRHPLKSSHRFRRFSQIFRLRFCLLICAHLCLSVGGTSLPECSVCSVYSVGTLSVCFVGAAEAAAPAW